ncbi:Lysophospholipid acyltransferase 5 [Oopsacas minuta]|uniref:Lysophospholipid acyltransferase 5 n=1 Tax=Oopsacas minuta TaxID=111878 RepID=A0AAV7JCV9_9METZ|nr:Lysophospholipid acyltransferase 5 [Oopsacas minuta]
MDPAPKIALIVGIDEGGTRILLTLIASFIFGYPYNLMTRKLSPNLQHTLNAITGIAFMYYCIGVGIIHCLFDICVIAILLNLAGGTLASVFITWLLVFGHLLWGYTHVLLEDSEVRNWTTPHTVITLKLIGLATSLYDAKTGKKINEKSSIDCQFALNSSRVQVMEVLGFCCLFCSCIVGPQIPFRRYREFINGTLYDREKVGGNMSYALNRLGIAIFYSIIYVIISLYIPPVKYLLTPMFERQALWKKILLSAAQFYFFYKQFTFVWLMAETGCITYGISYVKEDSGHHWRGCACVFPLKWETATSGRDLAYAMNISVNTWVIYYIYKRLMPYIGPLLSQIAMALFICIWHGLYPGIFFPFLHQIPLIYFDRIVHKYIETFYGKPNDWSVPSQVVFTLTYVVYLNIYEGFEVPFALLTLENTLQFYKAVNYYGFYINLIEIPIGIFLNHLIRSSELKTLKKSQ